MAGFTTDTWVGVDVHLRMNEETGKTEFVITDELIESFGADVVPETNYLLYNYTSEGAECYYTDDLESVGTQAATVSKDEMNQYAFDKDGNMYFLQSSGGKNVIIKGTENIPFTEGVGRILIDRKNNILYGVSINQTTLNLYRYDHFISGPEDDRTTYTTISNFSFPSDTQIEIFFALVNANEFSVKQVCCYSSSTTPGKRV